MTGVRAPRSAIRLLAGALAVATLAGCGGGSASTASQSVSHTIATRSSTATAPSRAVAVSRVSPRRARPRPRPRPGPPADHYPAALTGQWQVISRVAGQPAMWIAERSGVTLVRMDQHLVHLALHAGTADPGGAGWHYGPQIEPFELPHVVLGFNGGFKFSTGAGGFFSFGRVGLVLQDGLGSIVTYSDGLTAIGAWRQDVPAAGRTVVSVRQNLHLLIAGGRPASSVASCGSTCWGATIRRLTAVARSGLGITSGGELIWAAGEGLTVGQLASAMTDAGVQNGVELDINPDWVAGYLYVHHGHLVTPVPVVPGQIGIYGHLLAPYSRDFFTVLANG